MSRFLLSLGLLVAMSVGCTGQKAQPRFPSNTTTLVQPKLGPEPNVYGPTKQPCNGPNCPRPRR